MNLLLFQTEQVSTGVAISESEEFTGVIVVKSVNYFEYLNEVISLSSV